MSLCPRLSPPSIRVQPAVSPGRPHQLCLDSHSASGAETGSGSSVRPHPALHPAFRRAQGLLPHHLLTLSLGVCSSSCSSSLFQMTNPAIQNDFSYYRRTISRMRINNLAVSLCTITSSFTEATLRENKNSNLCSWVVGVAVLPGGIIKDTV